MFASVHLVCHRAIAILVVFSHFSLPLIFVIRVLCPSFMLLKRIFFHCKSSRVQSCH